MEYELKIETSCFLADHWCIYDNYDCLVGLAKLSNPSATDVGLGLSWSNYWKKNNLHEKYGKRFQIMFGWHYPILCLDEFANWFNEYLLKIKTHDSVIKRNNPILPIENIKNDNAYSGKTILLTGFSNEDKDTRLIYIAEKCNITIGKSVNGKLDFLVCGPNNDISGKFTNKGKQKKARELNIPIIPADTFIDEITL